MTDTASFRTLRQMFRYNGWANAHVFAHCREVGVEVANAKSPGTYGSIEETAKHYIGVESAFLIMVEGRPLESRGSVEEFMAHDLVWFADQVAPLTDGFLRLLSNETDELFDREIKVPWLPFRVTAHDGLLQVLTHSALHREQILSLVSSLGHHVDGLDYVRMVGEAQRAR